MINDFAKYHWFLRPAIEFNSIDSLLEGLEESAIIPAERKLAEGRQGPESIVASN